MSITIKKATVSDLPALRQLAEASFIATYAAHNPPHIIEPYIKGAFSNEQLQEELEDSANSFFVAVDGDSFVGYLKLRVGEIPDCISNPKSIEIERIYADPDRKRQGIGSSLINAAVERAKSMGYTSVWLGVFQKNEPAVAFYQKQGFAIAGDAIFMMGDDPQKDYVMVKAI